MSDKQETKSEPKPSTELPNILSEIKDLVFERIKNPFFASFTVAWVVINWKLPVYIIASKEEIEKKFEIISGQYAGWDDILVYPLLVASVYVFFKDQFFNLIEKNTDGFFIARKKTEVIKINELIELEKEKVGKLAELQDARDKNKLTLEIQRLQTVFETEKGKVSTLTKEKEKSKRDIEKLVTGINYEIQFHLDDVGVNELMKVNIDTLELWESQIKSLKQMINLPLGEKEEMMISDLKANRLLADYKFHDNRFLSYSLTSRGSYLLKRLVFLSFKNESHKINFNKKDFGV